MSYSTLLAPQLIARWELKPSLAFSKLSVTVSVAEGKVESPFFLCNPSREEVSRRQQSFSRLEGEVTSRMMFLDIEDL